MKSTRKTICAWLMVSAGILPTQVARAEMIATDQVLAKGTAQENRQRVLTFASRLEIIVQLKALGVPPELAIQRAAAMTDEEINSLAGKVDLFPAGGVPFALLIAIFGFLIYWAYVGPAGSAKPQ